MRRPLPPPQGIAHSWQPSASRLKDGDDAYRYGQVKPSEIRGAWKPRAMWSGERAPPWVPAGKLYRPSTAKGLPDPVRGGHPWNPVYDNFPEEDVQRGLSNAYTTSTTFWRRQRASEHKVASIHTNFDWQIVSSMPYAPPALQDVEASLSPSSAICSRPVLIPLCIPSARGQVICGYLSPCSVPAIATTSGLMCPSSARDEYAR